MAKLIEITGKALSGEWGTDDETGCGIPVLRTTNFTNEGIVNYRNVVTRTITKKKIAEKYLRQGDIIIEKSGGSDKQPVGRVIYFDGPDSTYLFNNFTGLLRVKDRNVWYPRYVFYSLFFNYRRGGTKAFENKTTGLHNLKVDDYVSRCEVRVENIQKQVAICEQLDRIFDIIRARQQQLQKLDELIKARFVELFGDLESNPFDWPVCALKELVSIEPQNGLYKPQSAYVQDGSGFPIVRIDAFYNGRVTDFSALKRLECSESEVQRYLLQEDDIVINRVNSIEYLGKCAHIKGLLEETVFESNMMRLHLDDTVMNAVFATKLLCSQYMHKQIMIRAKKAVNQASINQQDVLSFRMFVPPLELQEQFAAFVEQTDKSKSVVQKALDVAQLLFDSLMQQYFG